jgi:hypothetical protein
MVDATPTPAATGAERARERLNLYSVPVGSLFGGPEPESSRLYDEIGNLPDTVRALLGAESTGAFLRGVTKRYGLPEAKSARIAFTLVQWAIDRVELPKVFAATLSLPPDKAQAMAAEIERDLLAPVQGDVQQYWQTKQPKQEAKSPGSEPFFYTGASTFPRKNPPSNNVLDLKKERKPPSPPPMSSR